MFRRKFTVNSFEILMNATPGFPPLAIGIGIVGCAAAKYRHKDFEASQPGLLVDQEGCRGRGFRRKSAVEVVAQRDSSGA
jgi:hypothetical protein